MGNILVPFKKFLSNKNTITILGVLLGVVVLYLGYTWRVNRSIQPTQIPLANKTLIQGKKITEEDIAYTSVPKDTLKNMVNIKTNVQDINGMLVSYDSKIAQNSFFFAENLISEEEMPDSIFSNIPDGHTIYKLAVTVASTYGNSIFPGDKIDIYMTANDEAGKLMYGRMIKSIEVLAVKDSSGKNVFADKDHPGSSAILMFSVPENLFLLLKKAEKLGISLEPIPRNSSYTINGAAVELTNEELEAFIINQTRILQNECQDLTVCG